ncbi:MAG: hypothetical protein AB7I79_17945 [Rhizobiaceae bacterium]
MNVLRGVATAVAAAVVLRPEIALAHASDRGFVLLLPTGYYVAGGAAAVAASFIALAFLPAGFAERYRSARIALPRLPKSLRIWTSLGGLLVAAILITAGFWGSRDPLSNPLPLTVWTLMWIALTLFQGLIGDLWRWINPLYAPSRLAAALNGRPEGFLELPKDMGWWPAIILFLAFAWFELVYPAPDDPYRLANAALVYFLLNLVACGTFGFDQWSRRGECLGAFWTLIARFAPIGREEQGRMTLSLPGARLADGEALPASGALFLLLALASVSFDGLSRTFFWLAANGYNPLEFPGRTALIPTNTTGLVSAFLLLSAAFLLCVAAGERLAGHKRLFPPAGLLVWSIVPIALAYHLAHYLTSFLVNGQYALVALSDPFSLGWNLFGTATMQVTPGVVMGAESAWVLWNLQAGAIIVGHVLAVLAAHTIAQKMHASNEAAAVSQIPLTMLMIGYTVLGLWLLSTPTAA